MKHLQRLQSAYPPREARAIYQYVMEKVFGLSQTDILLGKDTELSAENGILLENIMQRLLQNEPVQYVVGEAEFCQRTFRVAPGVLIPRPETQQLVADILQQHPSPCSILDIGTGSGCIAISLALEGHQVTAMDISKEALAIASDNAQRLQANVDFVRENILQPKQTQQRWDVIVSNPPYICQREAQEMDDNVLRHEPHLALFVPDDDPLLFYRAIAAYGQEHLHEGGRLYFEINRAYPEEVKALLSAHGYANIQASKDIFDNYRFIQADKA